MPDDLLTLAEIAPIIGVAESSIRTYHDRAERNRREENPRPNDMPAPDYRFERTPVWKRATINAWKERRS